MKKGSVIALCLVIFSLTTCLPQQVQAFTFSQAINDTFAKFPQSIEHLTNQYAAVGEGMFGTIRNGFKSLYCLVFSNDCSVIEETPFGVPVIEDIIVTQSPLPVVTESLSERSENYYNNSYTTHTYPTTYITLPGTPSGLTPEVENFVRNLVSKQSESTIRSSNRGNSGGNSEDPTGDAALTSLEVTGIATSTFASGINITDGCFAINDVCIGVGAGLGSVTSVGMTVPTGLSISGSPVTTSGTLALSLASGYVIPLTASTTEWSSKVSSQWTTSGDDIYHENGNVGIGTATPDPDFALSIYRPGIPVGYLSIGQDAGSRYFTIDEHRTKIGSVDGGGTLLTIDPSLSSFIFSNGNVGIGTTTPYAKLSVAGQIVGQYITATGTTASTFPYASSTAFTTNNLFVGSLTGPLQAQSGVVSATTSVGVKYGGTGLTTAPSYGQLLVGNASNGYTLSATSSLGLLSLSGGTMSGNIDMDGGRILAASLIEMYDGSEQLIIDSDGSDARIRTGAGSNLVVTSPFFNLDNAGNLNVTSLTANTLNGDASNVSGNLNVTSLSAGSLVGSTINGDGSGITDLFGFTGSAGLTNFLDFSADLYLDGVYADTLVSQDGTTYLENGLFNTTGKLLTGDGGAGIPSLSFVSDTDTGIYRPDANTLGFSTGGVEQMVISASGNVGIGTTSPYAKLSVVGQVVGEYFTATSTTATSTFSGGLRAGGSTGLYVLQNGNVGIGTSSPVAKLDVVGGINFSNNSNLSQSGVTRIDGNGRFIPTLGSAGTPGVQFLNDSNTGIFSPSGDIIGFSTAGTERLRIDTVGNVGIGTTSPFAKLSVHGTSGGSPLFLIASSTGGTATTTHFTVLSNGNVGIGTTTPGSTLSVQGASSDASNAPTAFAVYGGGGGGGTGGGITLQGGIGFNNGGSLNFIGGNGQSRGGDILLTPGTGISTNGGVGIGTSTPWKKLSVTGTVAFDGLTTSTGSPSALCLSDSKEVTVNTGASTCTVSSARFKHDIETLDIAYGLDFVRALNPVSFEYNETNRQSIGFIAEEVAVLDSRLVFYEADGITPRGVNYESFAPIFTKAIQELYAKIQTIESTLTDIGNYFADKIVSIKEAVVGTLRIGDKVCVDDVCVTKEQFKALLINAGGAAASQESDNNLNSDTSDDTQAEDNTGTNTDPVEEGSIDTNTDESEPTQEDPIVTDEPEVTASTPDPVESNPEPSTSEPAPESEPSSESTDSPTE